MIYHIVAMANNRVIGKDNKLPWHFSADLKHFKNLTTGNTVIMGRKTHESIGRALPNRDNFVLSRSAHEDANGIRFFDSVEKAIAAVKAGNVFIIGGAEIYKQTLPLIDGVYLTQIHADYEGDAFYPDLPPEFSETEYTKLQDNPLIEMKFYLKETSDV